MATINPHTTRAAGTLLTAAIYNSDHVNHVTNATALNNDVGPLAGINAVSGLLVRTGGGAFIGRTIVGVANETDVVNGNGTAGNPTVGLPAALTFTGKTVTGGVFTGGTYTGSLNGPIGGATPNTISGTTLTLSGAFTGVGGDFSGTLQADRFEGAGTAGILGPAAPGTVFLRPQGVNSTSAQFTVINSGHAQGERFISESGVFSTTPAGSLFLRPNGQSSSLGQLQLSTSGTVTVAAQVNATGIVTSNGETLVSFEAIAGSSSVGLGTYVFARPSPVTPIGYGANISGATLRPTNVDGDALAPLTGTYQCMGNCIGTTITNSSTLWRKVGM